MPLPRLAVVLATIAAAAAALAAPASAVDPQARTPDLQFLGQAVLPTGTTFAGTEVGGLSSISYDAARDVYYVLSDDRSQINPARFYTVAIDLDGSFDAGDIEFRRVTTLDAPGGGPYPALNLDPEGLALTKAGELVLTSEGDTNRLIDPFVRLYDLGGHFLGSLPVPAPFLPTADHSSGVRNNLAFEPATVAPNGRFFFTGTENA